VSLDTSAESGLRGRDFLEVADLDPAELSAVLDLAGRIKAGEWSREPLRGRAVAMLFQKPSMRTRVSFEVGIARLGGKTITLTEQDVQLGVREPVEDAARVLDRYVDGVVARMRSHSDLVALAAASRLPIVNALTDAAHPCQILADLMTLGEARGRLAGLRVAFVGDSNNVASSLMEAAVLMGFTLTMVSPPGFLPGASQLERVRSLGGGRGEVLVTADLAGVAGADAVYTDVWISMGHEAEREARLAAFRDYQVNERLMALAPDAIFMHCLPARRGEEVTDGVIDGPSSVVFEQAANRLHVQMALLALML
jgi:ornithine carbamoyltransferase